MVPGTSFSTGGGAAGRTGRERVVPGRVLTGTGRAGGWILSTVQLPKGVMQQQRCPMGPVLVSLPCVTLASSEMISAPVLA